MAASINDALDQPVTLSLRILEDRHYLRTLQRVKTTKLEDMNMSDPMVGDVMENMKAHSDMVRAQRANR